MALILTTVGILVLAPGIKSGNKALTDQRTDIPIHMQLPMMEEILKLCQSPHGSNNTTFTFIVQHLAGAVIGQRKWKTGRCYIPLSTSMTISDEAFMLLLLKNQYNMWKEAETTRVG